MWELVKAGGWLMIPLLLCSIFTLAISVERFLRLSKSSIIPDKLLLTNGKDIHTILKELSENNDLQKTTLGRIFLSGYYASREDNALGQNTQAQMEVTASQEIIKLEKYINFLGTLSAIAPLLGLLGTVLGIIDSFLGINLATNNDPSAMIPGISKALITTAAGMLIAIPALLAYRYFHRQVNEYIAILEQQATLFHAALFLSKRDK